MSLGEYLEGLLFFVLTVGSLAVAAELMVRRRLRGLRGSPRILAVALVLTVGIVAVHLLPGILGVLGREVVAGLAIALLVVARRLPKSTSSAPTPHPAPGSGRASWTIAAAAVVGSVSAAIAFLGTVGTRVITSSDSLLFHFPVVANWIQTGTFWQVDQYTPYRAPGNYPQSGDVVSMASVLPWSNDAFVRFFEVPFLVMTGLAVYALARELRAPRAPSALFGAVVVSLPIVIEPALRVAFPDTVLLATFATGLVFLLRHWRVGEGSDLLLAGLGLGVAFGTKWYGVSSVTVVLALWSVLGLLARRGLVRVLRQGAVLTGLVLLLGGFWLVRNLVISGSPVFPAGLSLFDVPEDFFRELTGGRIVDHLADGDVVWRSFLPGWFDAFHLGAAALIAATLAGLVAAARGLRSTADPASATVLALAALAVLLVAVYAVIPYTAYGVEGALPIVTPNARYAAPAAIPAAAVAAWAAGRLGRLGLGLQVLGLLAVGGGLIAGLEPKPVLFAASFVVGSIALAAALVALREIRWRPGAAGRSASTAAVVGVAGIVVATAGYQVQESFNERRFLGLEPTLHALLTQTAPGADIGVVGRWGPALAPVYPAFGPRLENDVTYVGPVVDGMLADYVSPEEFTGELRAEGYDYLLVGRHDAPWPAVDAETLTRSAGYVPVSQSEHLTLFRAPDAELSGAPTD